MPSMSLKERVRAETSSRRRTVPAGSTSPTITSEKTTTWHKIYETSTNDFFYRVSVKSTLVNFPPHVFFFFFKSSGTLLPTSMRRKICFEQKSHQSFPDPLIFGGVTRRKVADRALGDLERGSMIRYTPSFHFF